ncbi:hypothetical protein ACIQ1J_15570 [Streptomyces sp. NPDC097107]|uniref:hypothetical protein n=1 Tax=Streptomyces sp. NPDC097107 TaxID=3366089 RepID=UPI00380079DF
MANGPMAGRSLHRVLGDHPEALMGAGCGEVEITGPADVLIGYLPDLDPRDVRGPLLAAGYPMPLLRRFIALSAVS